MCAFIEHVSGTVPGHQETKANKTTFLLVKGAESAGADRGECRQAGPQVCVPGRSWWAERAGGRRVGRVAKSRKGNWCLPESQGLSSRGGSVSFCTWVLLSRARLGQGPAVGWREGEEEDEGCGAGGQSRGVGHGSWRTFVCQPRILTFALYLLGASGGL